MAVPTYTYYHSGTDIVDLVRGLIPDRVDIEKKPPARFSNEELQRIAGLESNDPFMAAASCCEILATEATPNAISFSVSSGVSVSKTSVPSFYLSRAKQLRSTAQTTPSEYVNSAAFSIGHYGDDRSEYIGNPDDMVGDGDEDNLL